MYSLSAEFLSNKNRMYEDLKEKLCMCGEVSGSQSNEYVFWNVGVV
jgi:hypothetical protein